MARRLREIRESIDELTQAREDAVVAAYRKGGGMREIAEEVGMSHGGVSRMLARLGERERETAEQAQRRLGLID